MSTKIEIVNLALTLFGSRRVQSLAVSNEITRTVNTIYPQALDMALTALNWTFARQEAKLALIRRATEAGVQPVDGWEFLYAQPAKCLKARRVFAQGQGGKDDPDPFAECLDPLSSVKALATDVEDAYAQFTIRIEDTTQYDAPFVDALSAGLASKICLPLTKDKQLAGAMVQLYKNAISEAARRNVSRQKPKKRQTGGFISSRS